MSETLSSETVGENTFSKHPIKFIAAVSIELIPMISSEKFGEREQADFVENLGLIASATPRGGAGRAEA
jgi:hypothetical protein